MPFPQFIKRRKTAAATILALCLGAALAGRGLCERDAAPPPENATLAASHPREVRPPAVAGRFYPAGPAELSDMLTQCFRRAVTTHLSGRLRALVVPHAGYEFSGPIAASAYSVVKEKYKRVMILAASHHARYAGVSVAAVSAFHTPLGDVPLDPDASILRGLPGFGHLPAADGPEHSIEVQLPFLQKVLPSGFTLVPLLMSEVDPLALARALIPHVDSGTLVVASSDLSHYHPYDDAKALDAACGKAIPSLDFSGMDGCEACGKTPVLTLMEMARISGWKGVLLDLRNSGDTSGPKDRVVGYAAIAFVEPEEKTGDGMEQQIPEKERGELLRLARTAITAHLIKDSAIERPADPSPLLAEKRGCFVTLHKAGQLRGCIGTILPVMPLSQCVEENAVNAAFSDPRFPALTAAELSEIEIEISVLTVPKPLSFSSPDDLLKKLKPGVQGVILSSGHRRATFLPQVWEQIGNPESFLIHLCVKAGCTPNCWKSPDTKIEVYEAEYFAE